MDQHNGENNNPKDEKQKAIENTWRKFISDCETNQPEDQCLAILFRERCLFKFFLRRSESFGSLTNFDLPK